MGKGGGGPAGGPADVGTKGQGRGKNHRVANINVASGRRIGYLDKKGGYSNKSSHNSSHGEPDDPPLTHILFFFQWLRISSQLIMLSLLKSFISTCFYEAVVSWVWFSRSALELRMKLSRQEKELVR